MTMLDRAASKAAPTAIRNAELEQLQQALAAVLETEPGKRLFAHLFYRAGYNRAEYIGVESALQFNQARRALYAEIRALVPASHRKVLSEVELLAEDGWGSGNARPAPQEKEAIGETHAP